MRLISASIVFCTALASSTVYSDVGHGEDYDCHGNEGYGQLGNFDREQYYFGNLKQPATSQSPCMEINQKLGLDGDRRIKCEIDSKGGKPPRTDWDAFYTENWTKKPRDKRVCERPGDMCGARTTNMSGISYLNGQFAMKVGFPFTCKECAKEFIDKVKMIECQIDPTSKDKKNHLVLENGHLIIKAAPGADGNEVTLIEDIDRIFPSVAKYFERTGYAR